MLAPLLLICIFLLGILLILHYEERELNGKLRKELSAYIEEMKKMREFLQRESGEAWKYGTLNEEDEDENSTDER